MISVSCTTVKKNEVQNMLREILALTQYAKRNVEDSMSNAWRLFTDKSMLHHIKKCTEAEVILNNEEIGQYL